MLMFRYDRIYFYGTLKFILIFEHFFPELLKFNSMSTEFILIGYFIQESESSIEEKKEKNDDPVVDLFPDDDNDDRGGLYLQYSIAVYLQLVRDYDTTFFLN